MLVRHKAKSHARVLERLESRQLLTAQLNYPNFSSTTGLVFNGFSAATTAAGLNNSSSTALEVTDGSLHNAHSVLSSTQVPIDTFTAHFTYTMGVGDQGTSNETDGIAFVIDNGTTADLGADGDNFGYSSGTFGSQSVAVVLDLDQGGGPPFTGSGITFESGGIQPGDPINGADATPINFHSGDTIDATVSYDGTNLTISLVDASNTSQTFSTSEPINLAQVLGGHVANVGFTGGTGNSDAVQQVGEFDFTGALASASTPPTINTPVASSPTSPTSTKAHLSVSATSNSGGTLSYSWSFLHLPPGAATPTFEVNNSTTANTTTAHFFKDGTYKVRVTVTDSNGGVQVSDEDIVVQQTATQIKITPHAAQIATGATEQYTATVDDQFGHAMRDNPTIAYAVETGSGTIDDTGLFTAGEDIGHLLISATGDDFTGVAGGTVIS
jgi:hypothetical protein